MAGYTGNDNTLGETGYRLLKDPYCLARIEGRISASGLTVEDSVDEMASLAFGPGDLIEVINPNTGDVVGRRWDKRTKQRALETLMRYGGALDGQRFDGKDVGSLLVALVSEVARVAGREQARAIAAGLQLPAARLLEAGLRDVVDAEEVTES